MFNRDGLFGKKDETGRAEPRNDPRGAVNITPGLGTNPVPQRPQQPVVETPRPDLRFAEPAAAKPAAKPEEPSGSRLIVGPDIKLRGVEITDCDTLVVEGRVEASMDSRVIQISENGVFSGTVSIDVAEIRGRFEGELTARKQLVVHASGRVSGRIRYGTIRIEEGGEVSGEISTLSAGLSTASASPATASVATPSTSGPTPSTPSVAPSAPATPAPAGAAPTTAAGPLGTQRPAQAGLSATLPEIPPTPVVNAPPQASRPQSKNQGKAGAGINTA
jgi:cytoskeletal protein CcmA (bactofilin family)